MSGTDGPLRISALVSGHVQGVGFRWFVRQQATAAGLAGSARNLDDGRVEVVLQGPPDAVRHVLAALEASDAPGRVTEVTAREEPPRDVSGFSTA